MKNSEFTRPTVTMAILVLLMSAPIVAHPQACPDIVPGDLNYWIMGSGQGLHWDVSGNGSVYASKSKLELANAVKTSSEANSPGYQYVLTWPGDGTIPICYRLYINGQLYIPPFGGNPDCGAYFTPQPWNSDPYPCPMGYSYDFNNIRCVQASPSSEVCPRREKERGIPDFCPAGNPINHATGNKYLVEADYVGVGPYPLTFVRHYSKNIGSQSWMGLNWRTNLDRSIYRISDTEPISKVSVARPDGKTLYFNLISGIWKPDADVTDTLERIVDGGGNPTGWKYTSRDDESENYDVNGRLTSLRSRAGLTQTLAYDSFGKLLSVVDSFGRSLTFTYNSRQRISTVTNPGGGVFSYSYDSYHNLASVTYPDGKIRTYVYENANFRNAVTGIVDENGARFATYSYDAQGRAVTSEHTGGAEHVTVAYNSNGTSNVTDSLGRARTFTFTTILDGVRCTAISGGQCNGCGAESSTYDIRGFPASRTDWNGNRTNFVHDARGLETSRTEGLTSGGGTTPQTRTITTTWHSTYRLPSQIAESGRATSFTHDATGNVLTKTVTAGSSSRTWTFSYNANGSVLTIDGPRTDVSDVTTYTYYDNAATCPGVATMGCRGQVETITNAAGHVTQIAEYNAHGQPLTFVDPNGLTTTLAYDARQRLTSRSLGGEITSYDYDDAGQLTRVTLPDGSFLAYTYDNAHRLTEISDNLGNRIVYTLDLMGNRTLEEVRDPANQLAQTRSRVYNNLNRLAQEIGATGQATAYGYDNQGNLTSVDGPLAGTVDVTANAYDALNRLIRVTDPNSGQVNYGYNALDQLASVSDPRTLVTTYNYDGLNNLNQQISPDTGTTTNTYDAAGNLLTSTDAKGQVTSHSYDALNRVASITYQGGVTHAYQYDQGSNGKGRLTQITEPDSTTQYVYDPKGRLATETRTLNAVAYVTSYSYDAAGRMTGMTYPSGRQVSYTLDALGRIQQITTTRHTTQTVVSSVTYRPFGPSQGFTFGSGQTYTRGFDQDGRVSSYTLATQSFAVGYDLASRITCLSDTGSCAGITHYGYDNLDRLTQAILPATAFGYGYDAVGNRLSRSLGGGTDTYAYGAASNRLASITPSSGPFRSYVHDANGSITADGLNTYAYDTRGRLVQAVSAAGTTNYQVNSLGQRIRKTNTQGDTVYHYNIQGRLIAESSTGGTVQKEYIYLGDIPVAVIQ